MYRMWFDILCCFCSYCCTGCAAAQARTQMDGSSCCFNYCAMNPIVTRWLIRSAYGIPGSEFEDCYMTMCCPCCTINQMYQTTAAYGNPTPDGGAVKNQGYFVTQTGNCSARAFLCSCFCFPCAIASTLQMSMGMPFWFGCCCVGNNFCVARNLVRYQFRIAGDDFCSDYCFLSLIYCIGPCMLMKVMTEVESRTKSAGAEGTRYLHNIGGVQMEMGHVQMVQAQVVMVPANAVIPVNHEVAKM